MTGKPHTISWWRIGYDAWGADLLDEQSNLVRPTGHDESFTGDAATHDEARKQVRALARKYSVPRSRIWFDPDTTESMRGA